MTHTTTSEFGTLYAEHLYEELKMARNNTLEMMWPQPNLEYCSSICLGSTEENG
jgi:hypothetical protein